MYEYVWNFETRHKIHKSREVSASLNCRIPELRNSLARRDSNHQDRTFLVHCSWNNLQTANSKDDKTRLIYKQHIYIQITHQHQTRKIKKVKAESCGKVVIAAETPVIAGTVPWRCRSRGFPESCPAKRSTEVKSATFWDSSANSYNAPCAPF